MHGDNAIEAEVELILVIGVLVLGVKFVRVVIVGDFSIKFLQLSHSHVITLYSFFPGQ